MLPVLLLWGLVHTGCFVVTQVRAIALAPEFSGNLDKVEMTISIDKVLSLLR
jgi:hypothetical protein